MRWHPGRGFQIDILTSISTSRGWVHPREIENQASPTNCLDDSEFNRDLWHGHDIEFVSTRNGSGNQSVGPTRFFGEMIIYSPGLRP